MLITTGSGWVYRRLGETQVNANNVEIKYFKDPFQIYYIFVGDVSYKILVEFGYAVILVWKSHFPNNFFLAKATILQVYKSVPVTHMKTSTLFFQCRRLTKPKVTPYFSSETNVMTFNNPMHIRTIEKIYKIVRKQSRNQTSKINNQTVTETPPKMCYCLECYARI